MKLTEQQQKALDKLNKAEEEFLLEIGWVKNDKHFSPSSKIFGYDSNDKLCLKNAVFMEIENLENIKRRV